MLVHTSFGCQGKGKSAQSTLSLYKSEGVSEVTALLRFLPSFQELVKRGEGRHMWGKYFPSVRGRLFGFEDALPWDSL